MQKISLIILLISTQVVAANSPLEIWATILVHGTVGLRANLSFSTFIRLIQDDIEHSMYKKIVEKTRQDPFFYLAQPMQEIGLKKIDFKERTSSSIFTQIIDKTLPSTKTVKNYYYTFGWSGLLSPTERYKEADVFYQALQKELIVLQKKHMGATIKFRLICYSHGGSVGLNLAAVKHDKHPDDALSIEELILLGAPIQRETDYLIHEPIFKKVYHLYSRKDYVQKLDCFSFRRFFSRRRFSSTWYHALPEKLVQIEVKVKARRCGGKSYCVDYSPGHAELWYFGWAPNSYRKTFPLSPLPLAVFAPSIIELINTYMPQDSHIVVELRPEAGDALLRKRHHHKSCKAPWITVEKLETLKKMTAPYEPDLLTIEAQDAHINQAICSATSLIPIASKRSCSIRHIGAYTIP